MVDAGLKSQTVTERVQSQSPVSPAVRRIAGVRSLTVVAFLVGISVMSMYRPLSQLEGGDTAIWDYISQAIVRGQIPYRDVVENKSPGAAYLSAAVMSVGKAIGLQDIIAVRLFYVLLAGLLSAVTFLVAENYLQSRLAAFAAFLIPLLSRELAFMLISGTRPKLPMILLGLMTIYFISKDRPFLAGFCSMLSCICWQPGLLFTGTAVLIFSKYLSSWRDGRALKVIAGAAIPLVMIAGYFAGVGALRQLWECTIHYNYSTYLPEGNTGPGVALSRLCSLFEEALGADIIWVKLSAAGLLIFGVVRVLNRIRNQTIFPDDLYKDALIIPPLVYLVFRAINYPGLDDLIPLFPFFGIFAAYLFLSIVRMLAPAPFFRKRVLDAQIAEWLQVIPISVALFLALNYSINYRLEPGRTLSDQKKAFEAISDLLEPDDRIYVHGSLEALVLLNRPNLNRYIFLARGTDDYVAAKLPGGFARLLEEMRQAAPRFVFLSRLQQVNHREELIDWVNRDYDRFPFEFAHNSVYVRKVSQ